MKASINPDEYYNSEETAIILEMGASSIYKHYRSPKNPQGLRYSEVGKRRFTKGSWILDYLDRSERKISKKGG